MSDTKEEVIWERYDNSHQKSSNGVTKIVAGVLALIPAPFFASVPLAAIQNTSVADMFGNGFCSLIEKARFPTIMSDSCYSLTTLFPNSITPNQVIGGIILTTVCLGFSSIMITLGVREFNNHKRSN